MSYFVGGAIVTGAVVGAYSADQASKRAADASSSATAASIEEQARQYDLTRADYAPWRETGQNALAQLWQNVQSPNQQVLPQFQGGQRIQAFDQMGNPLPQFDASGAPLPGAFTTDAQLRQFDANTNFRDFTSDARVSGMEVPEWLGGDRFAFDLEADQGYQFAVNQAVDQTMRVAGAQGKRKSGNVLAEISDRAAGMASQYADQAFNRQLATSQENFGRDVTGQNLTTQQRMNQFNINRDTALSNFDIAARTNQIQNANEMNRFNVATGANQLQNQNILAQLGIDRSVYDAAMQRSNQQFGRDVTGYGLDYQANMDQYNRDLNAWMMNRDVANMNYARDVGEYGMNYQQAQDMYNRDQAQLNWLATLAGTGQNATGATAAAGSNMANSVSNTLMQNAANQTNASNMYYGGINSAVQGGIGNYLAYNQQQNLMNAYNQPVGGDAYMPAYQYPTYGR